MLDVLDVLVFKPEVVLNLLRYLVVAWADVFEVVCLTLTVLDVTAVNVPDETVLLVSLMRCMRL